MWLEKETKEKWRYTLSIIGINLIIILAMTWAAYVFWDTSPLDPNIIAKFKNKHASYFNDWGNFHTFLLRNILRDVLFEEAWARGPTWLLMNTRIKHRTLFSYVALIVLGGLWAKTHVLMLPVLAVGMMWGVAVIKTRSLWPAFVCHATANLSLYFLVKILQYFQFIT